MVTLRVDVEAARARTEFASASRSVEGFRGSLTDAQREADRLGDELRVADARLAQATREFEAAERAADNAADEVRRLTVAVSAAGANPPRALVRELQQAEATLRRAEREEQRLRTAMEETNHTANQLSRNFNDAGDEVARITRELAVANVEADRLRRQLDSAQRSASNPLRGAQRGLLGFRQQVNQLLSQSPGQSLTQGISAAWSAMPVELKGVIVGAGVAMAAVLASAIGAALNGLLLTTVGLGVIGAMAAIAAKSSNVVQKVFADVFKPIKQDALDFASVAEGPLVHAALAFGQAWSDVRGDVRGAFADLAPEIADVADGVAGFVRNAMPGLRSAITASAPLLKELSRDLPILGDAVSRMFEEFSKGGDGARKGLRLVVDLVAAALIVIGQTIGYLSREFDAFTFTLEKVLGFLAKIPGVGRLFQPALEAIKSFNDNSEGTSRSLEGTGEAADRTALGMGRVADATQRASHAVYDLSQKMSDLMGQELSLSDANLAFNKSLLDVTASFKENGKTLDAHTEKGIANLQVVNASIEAARTARDRAIDLAGGQNASAAAVEAANAAYNAQVAQLEAVLRKAGLTKQQIDDLLGAYRNIAAAPNIEKFIDIKYRTSGANTVATSTYALPGGGTRTSSHAFNRYGGVWARQGLINLNGMAGLFSAGSPLFGFAEQGTGGEAFIARNAPRARSLAIAATAARWHGASLVPDEATRAAGAGAVRVEAELVPTSSATGAVADLINSVIKAGGVRLVVRQAGGRVGVVTAA